jgi:hypothetical protein
MKNKKSKTQQTQKSNANPETIERWWAKLSADDKQFIFNVGKIVDGFKAGLAANVLPAPDGVEQAMGTLFKQVGVAYSQASAKWPLNRPEKRGLN